MACREGHTCPNVLNGREVCIHLHSKVDCVRNCSRSHAHLCGKVQAEYIRFLNHYRTSMRQMFSLGSVITVTVVGISTQMGGIHISSIDAVEAYKYIA